jgi:hypothetical protein
MATARRHAGSTRRFETFLSFSKLHDLRTLVVDWSGHDRIHSRSRCDTALMHDLGPLCSRDNWAGFVAVSDSPAATPRFPLLHLRFDVWHGGHSRIPRLIRRTSPFVHH